MSPVGPGSARQMKTLPKVVISFVLGIGALLGLRSAALHGWIPGGSFVASMTVGKVALPELREPGAPENVAPLPLPGKSVAKLKNPPIIGEIWAWNAQAAPALANGGKDTTEGSILAKRGVNLHLQRQDDNSVLQSDLIACANQLKDGASSCNTGTNFVIIMGDGSGAFLAGLNPQLKKLGPEYIGEVIGSVGYSRGEDKLMGPAEWKRDPQSMKGALVAGVLRDGDWNISLKFEGDNGLKNNPDEKTYDPEAVNWVNAPDYIQAAAMYNGQTDPTTCEERVVVKAGVPTGEKKKVCINGVVTWTPGDVNVAKGRGGLVSIVSSKQYRSQMPAVIISIRKYDHDHEDEISNMLAGFFEAADQIKTFPEALEKATALEWEIYNKEQTPAYWLKYFKGVKEKDVTGIEVELGGSAVNNLADNLVLFGLNPGSNNNFKSTYNTFGKIVTEEYPKLVPTIPDVKEILNTSYLRRAQDLIESGTAGVADTPTYADASSSSAETVSTKSWAVSFDTGKATLTPDGYAAVKQMADDIAITGLSVRVDGHTDNSGSDTVNIPLSAARAQTVIDTLRRTSPNDFPTSRFSVHGYGSTKPKASNATASGKAANRRVEITLVQ